MKTRKKITVLSLLLVLGSFTVAGQSNNSNNGNNGNNGNITNNGNNGNNRNENNGNHEKGNIGKGQFKEKAQKMVAKTDEELSFDTEQKAELETQAEIMLDGLEQATNREEKRQLRQNYQMAMENILTGEQKEKRRQKEEKMVEEIKAQINNQQ